MKKIIVGIFSFALLFVAQSAFAATWNGVSGDCPDINIANYTTNNGYGSPCWNGTSITANPGDIINVKVYYHNTSNTTNTNTRIKLFAPTGSGTSHSFSAQILSNQGNLYTGNVSVSIPSSQTLTLLSAKWYPNQTQVDASLLNGQSSSAVTSGSGLNIGDIAPGWNTQGTINVAFKVSNTVIPPANNCTISNFSASPSSITAGQTSTLNWNTSDCITASISTVGSVNTSDSYAVHPTQTTSYILTAYGSNGVAQTKTTTVNVTQVPVNNCVINSFTASPSSISAGNSSVLNWSTSDCTNTSITNLNYNIPTSGAQQVWPTVTTTYTLSAYGANGGTQTKSVTINVTQTPVNNCAISSFTASPSTITPGSFSTLSWGTNDCISASISPAVGTVNANGGSRTVNPNQTTTYILTAYGSNGVAQTSSVVVYVTQTPVNNCVINSFTASNTSVSSGTPSVLTWGMENCTSANISPTVGSVNIYGGSRSVYPTVTTTYVLSAYGTSGGSQTKTVTIYVNNTNNNNCRITNFDADDTSIEDGDSVRLTWDTEDCDYVRISGVSGNLNSNGSYRVNPSSTRTYILNAYGDNDSDSESLRITVDQNNNYDDDDEVCTINNFTASNTRVNTGGSTRLNWNTSDCNSVGISYLGSVNTSGSQTVYPINNTNYVLTAYGPNGGIQTRSIYVTVNSYIIPTQPIIPMNNCAVTTVATNISQTGAQLNGLVTGTSGANTYFEYGTTVGMGYRTQTRYTNGGSNFSDFVNGLSPNTIYFFRMSSDCQGGLSQGSIEIFKTTGIPVAGQVKTVYVQQGTTVVGTKSPVMLTITNRYELISEGDFVDYVVTYKNISKTKLTKPMVQVVLPTNMTLVNASRGTYSVDTHTLSAQIEDLNGGQEGVIYLQGRVDSIPLNNSKIATTAILVYTTPNGAQENVMAYVINMPKIMAIEVGSTTEGSVLGGSAFFGGFLSLGLIGWLIIILIILLLILIARSAYRKNNVDNVSHTPTH